MGAPHITDRGVYTRGLGRVALQTLGYMAQLGASRTSDAGFFCGAQTAGYLGLPS